MEKSVEIAYHIKFHCEEEEEIEKNYVCIIKMNVLLRKVRGNYTYIYIQKKRVITEET